jgi:hypothetical protein
MKNTLSIELTGDDRIAQLLAPYGPGVEIRGCFRPRIGN